MKTESLSLSLPLLLASLMRRARPFLLMACAVYIPSTIFPSAAAAQSQRPAPKLSLRYTAPPIKASAQKPASKAAGDSLVLRVDVELPPGWHINSEAPPDSFLVPTRIDAEAQGLVFAKPRFPEPEMVFSQAMGEKLPLYTGTFEVTIPAVRAKGSPGPGIPVTRVTLHYQGCNDSMCLPPKDVIAELPAGVAER
jgi:DsbC/DsbD-like thiol-disulfide interchange protein